MLSNNSEMCVSPRKPEDGNPVWSPLCLFGFRLASSYLLLSWFTVYGVLAVLPWVGFRLEGWIEGAWQVPVHWVGIHMFHLTGVAAQFHPTDSRDTALDWITAGSIVPVALLSAVVWTVIDRRSREYRSLSVWLRYLLRLALIFLMLRYALMKVFPLQMPLPSLAVLNEPVGATSPMTLLWTLFGLHPAYEIVAGVIEATAALLLVFRKTALLGGLLTVCVMTNVLLYNLFFDVPVKLGAASILVLAIAIVAPDLGVLYRFFYRRENVVLTSHWAPKASSVGTRAVLLSVELLFVAFALTQYLPFVWGEWARQRANLMHPSPLAGGWHVDTVVRHDLTKQTSVPVLTGEGQAMTAIFLEPNGKVMVRSADGKLWRADANIDLSQETFSLDSGYFDGLRFAAQYHIDQPDQDHLILRPMGPSASTNGTISLTRIVLPSHYPLLDRKFTWVNEWALER